ncbi:MAG: hypothetical protein ACTHMA_18130 [Thermomicrobiales bacterium]
MLANIIESTFLLILAFLVLSRADAFSKAISALGTVYYNAVYVLQGRG